MVFMGSSFRLQLRGATEWDEPGTFIFEWCCQRCGPRPPHGPAAGPAIRPQPGRVSPGVTRRPRAVRSGQPLRAVRPKFLSASATCRISFERTVRAKGASLSRRRPMTRWRECSRTAAKALRRRLTEQARCAIKIPRVADGVRRLAGGMAKAYRYQEPELSGQACPLLAAAGGVKLPGVAAFGATTG